MTYALLLVPHLNARYFDSLKMLAYRECILLSRCLSSCSAVRLESIAGVEYVCFDGNLSQEDIDRCLHCQKASSPDPLIEKKCGACDEYYTYNF